MCAGVSIPLRRLHDVEPFRTSLNVQLGGIAVKSRETSSELSMELFQIFQGHVGPHVIGIGLSRTEKDSPPLQMPSVLDVHS